ncbi:MAG: D-alanine--D-alanine ligase, partial [Alphaproteobacteria bacterium]|nr:D-alanine--D-alanine ligase [Alphaproteobacteria bacterium]
IDRVFIALHGAEGEDGHIQAWLKMAGIPFTGSPMAASALCMDKVFTKTICTHAGVTCLPNVVFHDVIDSASVGFGYPRCIKPLREGSSFGVVRVDGQQDWARLCAEAMRYGDQWMVEPWVDGREFTVGIIQDQALPVIEVVITDGGFYDFEHKYNKGAVSYEVPCNLPKKEQLTLQKLSLDAYVATGCCGWARADFMQDHDGRIWFIEINTVPGLTRKSLVPRAAAAVGLSFAEMVLTILADTLPRSSCRLFEGAEQYMLN